MFLFISNVTNAQRLFWGLGLSMPIMHHSQMDNVYVIPGSISYDVKVIKKSQKEFTFQLPSLNLLVGVEYAKWRFSFEPGIQNVEFSYRYYYPTGNGLFSESTTDKETYAVGATHLNLPLYASYAIYQARKNNNVLYFQVGGSYSQNLNKDNYENIYYQNTYLWGTAGLTYQLAGMYRMNFTLRYNKLLNPSNIAKTSLGMLVLGYNMNIPAAKIQKRKLYED